LHNEFYSTFLIRIFISAILLLTLPEVSINSFAAFSDNQPASSDSLNNKSEKNISFNPYFTQTIHLRWQEEGGIGDFQGLLVPELGTSITVDPHSDISVCLDISLVVQIFDIYNIQFSPVSLNINQAYLNYKTDFSNKYMPDSFKFELCSDDDQYNDDIYNLGLETKWYNTKKDLEIFAEIFLYDLFSKTGYNFSNNNYGLTIGAQWYDIFNSEDDKHTDIKMEYSKKDNKIFFQITQQINGDLSLELTYAQHFSSSLTYNINENCQFEIIGLLYNTQNINNQPNQNIKEYSLITAFTYKF